MELSTGHGHKHAAVFDRVVARRAAASGGIKILVALVLALGTAGWSQPVSAGTQTIGKVQVTNLPDVVQISVEASRPLAIYDFRIGGGYLVFDLYGSLVQGQTKRVSINSGGISTVRCGWYRSSPAIARIAVSTSSKRPYTIRYSSGKRQATIVVNKSTHAGTESNPALIPEAPTPNVEQKPAAETSSTPSESDVVGEASPTASAPAPAAEPSPTVATAEPQSQPVMACTEEPAAEPVAASPAANPEAPAGKPLVVASVTPFVPAATAGSALLSESRAGTRVALDFVGTDIHDVLKGLSLESGVNVVASPEVKGEVTVSLNNVTVDEALRLVTNLSGYKFADVNGTYVVGTADNLKSLASGGASLDGEKVAEVAMIRYADADLISKTLAAQFEDVEISSTPVGDSKDSAPSGTRILVLSGAPDKVQVARALVAQIEESLAARAASTEVELYEVKYADINDLAAIVAGFVPGLRVTIGPNQGFDLQSPDSLAMGGASDASAGSSSGGAAVKKAPPKILILQGTASEIAKAKDFLAKVDVQQPQIMIEAKVLDIRTDASRELGIAWSWRDAAYGEVLHDAEEKPVAITLGKFNRSPVTAKVNALVESGKAKVLANPNVLALEGKPSSIFIGDEFKYVINIQQTTTGINVTTETARVGVQLHSVSRISSDGFITMDLHPEVSVIKSFLEIPQLGLAFPEISRRYIDSTIRVKDGETIVIGGLITEEEREAIAGIPFLSDLPIIGGLFKTTSKSKVHSEILIFITPRILTST